MNKVLASLLMIGMVAAMAGAGTFAYYVDTETSVGNTFTAGTLDLEVNGENPLSSSFTIENIQPSYRETVCKGMNLTNSGTCDGYLSMWMENLVDDDNGLTEPEGDVDTTGGAGEGELSQYLCIVIWDDVCGNELYNGTLANFTANHNNSDNQIALGKLTAGQTRYFPVGYYVPSGVGNIIQSDSSTFDVVIDLLQKEMPHPTNPY